MHVYTKMRNNRARGNANLKFRGIYISEVIFSLGFHPRLKVHEVATDLNPSTEIGVYGTHSVPNTYDMHELPSPYIYV